MPRVEIERIERDLDDAHGPATPDLAAHWIELIEGVENLDTEARMRARELTRASFSRIAIWRAGDPPGADDGQVIDIELTARGGGSVRIRIDRATGGLVE